MTKYYTVFTGIVKIYIVKHESISRSGERLGATYQLNLVCDYKFFVVEEILHICSSLFLVEKTDDVIEYEFQSLEDCRNAVDYLVNDWLKQPETQIYTFEEMVYGDY